MRVKVVSAIDRLEDAMYALVAILLAAAALLLIWSAASSSVADLQHSADSLTVVLRLLDRASSSSWSSSFYTPCASPSTATS